MGQITLPDNPGIEINIRQSARAKRLSLRVSSLDGRVTLTLPRGVSEREGRRFLIEKADWIRNAVAGVPSDVVVRVGAEIPVLGKPKSIVGGKGHRATLSDNAITAPEGRTGPAVRALLKAMARDRIVAATDHYSALIGRKAGRLTLRDTRSRWGSCSSQGDLMLSWRLILAPEHVLDYVAAHEVAHLEHMDHSAAFWGVVTDLRPDWKDSRRWLTQHGGSLHRYRFDTVD